VGPPPFFKKKRKNPDVWGERDGVVNSHLKKKGFNVPLKKKSSSTKAIWDPSFPRKREGTSSTWPGPIRSLQIAGERPGTTASADGTRRGGGGPPPRRGPSFFRSPPRGIRKFPWEKKKGGVSESARPKNQGGENPPFVKVCGKKSKFWPGRKGPSGSRVGEKRGKQCARDPHEKSPRRKGHTHAKGRF